MIRPLDDGNISQALDLLATGFPVRTHAFWEKAFARIQSFGGNKAAGLPVGQMLYIDDKPAGIALTLATTQFAASGAARRVVNFSSWYVVPEHRVRAPVMLRAIAKLPADVITDLTPSPPVARMLPSLGFKPFTDGVSLVPVPIYALKRRLGTGIQPLEPTARQPLTDALLAHRSFGGLPVVIEEPKAATPILLKFTRWRGAPAARIIYCADNAALYKNIGAVASFLLGQGALVLLLDLPISGSVPGLARRGNRRRFARGALDPNVVDYTGSEVALFDL